MAKYEVRDRFFRYNPNVTEPTIIDIPDDEKVLDVNVHKTSLGLGVEVFTIKEIPPKHKD